MRADVTLTWASHRRVVLPLATRLMLCLISFCVAVLVPMHLSGWPV